MLKTENVMNIIKKKKVDTLLQNTNSAENFKMLKKENVVILKRERKVNILIQHIKTQSRKIQN